jgi:uncharacterized membrane protein YbhN (UPF0104 family)
MPGFLTRRNPGERLDPMVDAAEGADTGESRPSRWRTWAPWVVAAAILGYIFASVPRSEVADAFERVSLWKLGVLVVVYAAGLLLADSLAMWVAFRQAIADRKLGYGAVVRMRGASYLLALVNYGAGQGGIVYFLREHHGVKISRGAAAVLLASGAFVLVIALAVGVGLLGGAVPDRPELRYIALAVVGALPAYLAVIAFRPAFLAKRAFLAPLFDAGIMGTLRVSAARAIHLGVLIAGHWAAMWLFGIEVPTAVALAQLPVVFLVAAVPISPSGLGTTQAAAITLFTSYAAGATDAAREASVLAYSLSFHFAGTAAVAAIGLVCLRLIASDKAPTQTFDSPADGA